jgi:hypothetical protein
MSTLEALNAISEAIEAHKRQPELEAQIKALTDDRDYVKLERDEAERTIDRLKARISELEAINATLREQIYQAESEVFELKDRNTSLDASLSDVTTLYNDAQHTIVERNLQIESLKFTADSLQSRLAESKSYGTRLAETLKSIGASIVAAVEVPEVTSEAPFPVANPVGLPDPAPTSLDGGSSHGVGEYVEPQAVPSVVEFEGPFTGLDKNGEHFAETAPGTNVYKYW